jgi:hypothetical protein
MKILLLLASAMVFLLIVVSTRRTILHFLDFNEDHHQQHHFRFVAAQPPECVSLEASRAHAWHAMHVSVTEHKHS